MKYNGTKVMSIAAAAKLLGVSIETLRNWERAGKLKPVSRTIGGHRRYDFDDIRPLIATVESAHDIISITVIYADGTTEVFKHG